MKILKARGSKQKKKKILKKKQKSKEDLNFLKSK